jgi:hypothetical protein
METIYLYGGWSDGATTQLPPETNYLLDARGNYTRSAEWSAYFKRPTFTASGFKGRPPVQTANA